MTNSVSKISGVFILLCGLAAAEPQAQVRTGVSARGPQETTAPSQSIKSQPEQLGTTGVSGRHRQKPSPTLQQPPVPVAPSIEQAQQDQLQQNQVQAPLRPEQMPPGPPKVSYQNGLLSVEATNSTLGDILSMIRAKAGIQMDGLQADSDRVATKLGPAPADTVLTALLRGSHFDYLILGRIDRPDIVQRVILTPSSSSGLAGNVSSAGIQPLQPRPGLVLVQPVDDDEGAPEEQQIATPQPQIQPMQQPGVQPQQAMQQSGNGQLQGNNPKTTEQLLEELKQMQMQQQQPQQGQPNMQPPAPLKPRIPQ